MNCLSLCGALCWQGESVAIVLSLLGAAPVREGTGRIARFELIPLEARAPGRIVALIRLMTSYQCSDQNGAASEDGGLEERRQRRHLTWCSRCRWRRRWAASRASTCCAT